MKSRSIRFAVTGLALVLGGMSLPLLTASSAVAQPAGSAAATAMTNADVIKLTKLGFDANVVKSKIAQAPAVNFKLEVNDLEGLKRAGVSQDVIAYMINRSSGGGAGAGDRGDVSAADRQEMNAAAHTALKMGDVTMDTTSGEVRLRGMNGSVSSRWAFVTTLMFNDYPGTAASVRTHDARPTFTVYSANNPEGSIYLVKLTVNGGDQNRSLKMGNSGFGSFKNAGAPDKDNQIPYEAKAVGNGNEWKLTPTKDLKPGEYGVLYGSLFDFGVDS